MNIEPTNAALAARYDNVPYAAGPNPFTHPDRLATVATMRGMSPPAVSQCRVLEVGCNTGANLIPMALSLPDARFVGCDISPRAIEEGRRIIKQLGLTNIDLLQEDLANLSATHAPFDYIIAHGVYSWVPANVRDALFELASTRLSSNGVMFVSFNVLPGCRVRQVVWDVLHFSVDHLADPKAKIAAARQLASIIAESGGGLHKGDEAVRYEFRAIAERSDSAIFHDDLASLNHPVYFHAFAAHAAHFGLRYLAEAQLYTMSAAGISGKARELLASLGFQTREQYIDFIRLRRYRQSLLVLKNTTSGKSLNPETVRDMHISADSALVRAIAEGKSYDDFSHSLDPGDRSHGLVSKLLEMLVRRAPASVPVAAAKEYLGESAIAQGADAFLCEAYVSNIVNLHIHPPIVLAEVSERPTASPLARLQARTQSELTSLLHARVHVPDDSARRLLAILDGSRDRVALAREMSPHMHGFQIAETESFVGKQLEHFARLGLLMA